MLTTEEIERYKRHLILKEIGGQGQQQLKTARVLVVGAGGLGSPILLYLAAAGVGYLGIIDDDRVSLDNLQRQILHDTPHIGTLKVESARHSLQRLNPHVRIETYAERLSPENALSLLPKFDVIVDGSDNFPTRYLISDACYFAQKPLVFAAVGPFDGYLTVFQPYKKLSNGTPYPSLRCLFPTAPQEGLIPACAELGVLGAVVGVLGTLQAVEVLKLLTGAGESLTGALLMYDAKETRFEKIKLGWNPDNPLTGRSPTIHNLSLHKTEKNFSLECTSKLKTETLEAQ